ncbi:MAG: HvfA family oxazolone/thioamide-modified RiPP metallophore [Panacagrimonas sp.]
MSNTQSKKPLAIVLGAAFALSGMAAAQASVFQTTDLGAGYMVAAAGDAKTGEHKCGEGKCGEAKKDAKAGEAKCGEGKCGEKKAGEAKCGDGKCGEKK